MPSPPTSSGRSARANSSIARSTTRVACGSEVRRDRRPSRRGTGLLFALVIEHVGGEFDQGHALRRGYRFAEGLPHVDGDAVPIEHAVGVLGEGPANLGPVRFLNEPMPSSAWVLAGGRPRHCPSARRRTGRSRHWSSPQPAVTQQTPGVPWCGRPAVGGVGRGLLVPHVDQLDAVVGQVGQDRKGVAAVDREQVLTFCSCRMRPTRVPPSTTAMMLVSFEVSEISQEGPN